MARRKPARRSKRSRQATRRAPRRTRAAKRARRVTARRKPSTTATAPRKTAKPSGKRSASNTRPISKSKVTRPKVRPTRRPAPALPPVELAGARRVPHAPPKLDRERRRLADIERLPADNRTEGDDRAAAAARSGHEELKASLARHTEASPTLTAGDLDARWEDAYAIGDEAPGGDNPTPDQDRVDDIGKALGVVYEDAEELRASDKVAERDRHRWELDPASSDDWPHEES